MNLANKYRPKSFEDVTEQSVVIDMIRNLCKQENLPNRNFLLTGPAGTGKAQPLTSLVLTPNGFVPMGQIYVGQVVYTHRGNKAPVSSIHPQGIRQIYKITLSDNTSIRVSDNHLNQVYYLSESNGRIIPKDTVLDTTDLIDAMHDRDYYVDSPRVTWPYSVYSWEMDEYFSNIDESRPVVIPSPILHSSYDSRISLLNNLWGRYEGCTLTENATTTSSHLIQSNDFQFLCRSLGITVTVSNDQTGMSLNFSPNYVHDQIFGKGSTDLDPERYRRKIVSIEPDGLEECQCIMIDHPDHTYISNDFVPTHNTTTARILANVLNDGKGDPIEVDAASHNGVDSVKQIVEQASTYPVGCNYKVFILDEVHAFSSQAWQAMLKCLEEGPARSVFCLCTTNPEKIPATIISRVQTFQLSKISLEGISSRLKYIIDCENKCGRNINYDTEAVDYIAKLANGGMRDAITLLDKSLAYSSNITSEGLMQALDLPAYDDYFRLLGSFAKHNNAEMTDIIDVVYNSGINFVKWFEGFHSFVVNIMKYILLQDINRTTIPPHYKEKISTYGPQHSAVCIKLANRLLSLNNDLKRTQYLQETAITYLCSAPSKSQRR